MTNENAEKFLKLFIKNRIPDYKKLKPVLCGLARIVNFNHVSKAKDSAKTIKNMTQG